MRRARQTAEFVRSTLSLPVEFGDRIAELDRGWTTYGVNLDAYPTRSLLFHDMNSGRLGENTFDPDAFREQAVAGVEDIVTAADDDSRVAVVCHGGVINAYLAHILGTDRLFFTFPPTPGHPGPRPRRRAARAAVGERGRPPALNDGIPGVR